MSKQETATTTVQVPAVWFDYTNQCWVKGGLVAKDGHQEVLPGCYACEHVGAAADLSHYEAD